MILKGLLLVLEVLSSILLISVILLQKTKGGGLGGSAFGGGGGESLFGARAGNVLTKITIGLSVFFLGNTLLLAFMYAGKQDPSLLEKSAGSAVPMRDVPRAAAPEDLPLAADLPPPAGVPEGIPAPPAVVEEAPAPVGLEQPVTVPPEIAEEREDP